MTAPQITALSNSSLYNQDFYLWLEATANQLKEQKFNEIDLDNLIEEIESMGRGEKQAVRSNLKVLLMHLLKYKYQPVFRSSNWRYTIIEHRNRIVDYFQDSPSLQPYFEQVFNKSYQLARGEAAAETDLPLDTFPVECPFNLEESLNTEFLPE